MAITRNIKSKTYSTVPIVISFFSQDGTTPLDLTNSTFVLTAREAIDAPVAFECSSKDGSIVVQAPGVIKITIAANKLIKPGIFMYDVFMFQPDFQQAVVEGTITLTQSITQKA